MTDLLAQLEQDFHVFWNAIQQRDYQQVIDYLHPHILTLIAREPLSELMKEALEDDEMSLYMSHNRLERVSNLIQHENTHYVRVYYSFRMQLVENEAADFVERNFELNPPQAATLDDTTLEEPETVDSALSFSKSKLLLTLLKAGFPNDKVNYHAQLETYEVQMQRKMYAFYFNGQSTHWHLLEDKPQNEGFIKQVVPRTVQKRLD